MAFKCCFGFFDAPNFDRNIFDRSNPQDSTYNDKSTYNEKSTFDKSTFEKSTTFETLTTFDSLAFDTLAFDEQPTKVKNPRQVLSSNYIRLLIEKHYEPTLNWFDFASISGISAFLQREYSSLINSEMVYEALKLEPHYKISHRMDAPGCRFIRHKI
jgi:hypothetical protein